MKNNVIESRTLKEQIEIFEHSLENKNEEKIREIFNNNHVADIALLIKYISPSLRNILITEYYQLIKPSIISELNYSIREELFDKITDRQLAHIFSDLEDDDAREIFENLDEIQQGIVLRSIAKKDRQILQEAMSYPEQSAGRVMLSKVPSVRISWSIREVLNYIKYTDDVFDSISDVFIVDSEQKLVGAISLCKLIRSDISDSIEDLMENKIVSVNAKVDQEEIAMIFKKYSLMYIPVTDDESRLVGIITADEVIEIVEQEIQEDYEGIRSSMHSDFFSPVVFTSIARMRWLFVTALSSIVTSLVISRFENVISQHVCLSSLMQVICAMGGAYGLQVNTVIVRAIATQELISINSGRTIFKEFTIALLNSVFFAISIGIFSYVWLESYLITIIFMAGIIANMIWGGLSGTIVPILLNKLGWDPALSSGPIVGMTIDMMGFSFFLGLAALVLL